VKLLIVCSANKGRSASMAAHLKHQIQQAGIKGLEVDSAGISEKSILEFQQLAASGKVPEHIIMGAQPMAKKAMLARGVREIEAHRVKLVTPELVEKADYVFAVNPEIRDALKAKFPECNIRKIMTARGFVTGKEGLSNRALAIDDAYEPIGKRGLYKGKAAAKSMKAFWGVTGETGRLAKAILFRLEAFGAISGARAKLPARQARMQRKKRGEIPRTIPRTIRRR